MHHRARKRDGLRVSVLRVPAQNGATGIPQFEGLGDLVERLAHGIVERAAQHLVVAPAPHVHEHGMPAAHEQRDKWWLERWIDVAIRVEMSLEMVHADEG